jgi:hypothetical protein
MNIHSDLDSGTWGYTDTATWTRARGVTQTQRLGLGHVGLHRHSNLELYVGGIRFSTWSLYVGVYTLLDLEFVRRSIRFSTWSLYVGVYASRLGVCT